MPAAYLAPSLATARAEANVQAPDRRKQSDGWIGNTAHAARKSEHNPDGRGCVHALDLTHDPAHGWDCHLRVAELVTRCRTGAERRPWYIVWNGAIYSKTYGWTKRVYRGANKHTTHMHISLLLTRPAEANVAPWWPRATVPAKPPAVPHKPLEAAVPGPASWTAADWTAFERHVWGREHPPSGSTVLTALDRGYLNSHKALSAQVAELTALVQQLISGNTST